MGPVASVPAARERFPDGVRRLGLVGLGLMGGSLAAAASERWPDMRLVGVDRPDVLAEALRRGWIHEAREAMRDLSDADLIVLAAPVPEIIARLAELGRLGVGAPVTDVGSTKRRIMEAANRAGLTSFAGGHPMAGAERGGLEHARPDLFVDRPWLVVPTGSSGETVARRVEALASGVGGRPVRVDADTHDRIVAYVSHLPQLVAVALMNAAGEGVGTPGLTLAGRSLREMTRLASSPPDVWLSIIESNADHVAEAVARLRTALEAIDPGAGETTRLPEEFAGAARFREALDRVMS